MVLGPRKVPKSDYNPIPFLNVDFSLKAELISAINKLKKILKINAGTLA